MKLWQNPKPRPLMRQTATPGRQRLFLAAGGFGVFGLIAIVYAFAAGPLAAFEAESGTLSAGAVATALTGASGGQAVLFAAPTTPTPTPTPTGGTGTRTCPAYPAFPDANCTGVPAGTSLTAAASYSSTGAGQTISGLNVSGDINIGHNNVTIVSSRVKGHIVLNNHTGIQIIDSDVGPDACPATGNGGTRTVVGDNGYTLLRTHIHNNGDDLMSIGGNSPVLYQDSIIDKGCFYAGDHLDAVQWYDPGGTGNITIAHSIIDVRPVNSSDKGNASVFFADGAHSGTKLTMYNNKFGGGNVSTALYDAVKNSGIVIDVHDNTYIKNSYAVEPCSFGDSVKSIAFDGTSGVKFANNVFDVGGAVTCN